MGYQNSSRHVSGMQVTDRPEGPMDFSVFASLSSMTPDAQKAAHMAGRRRALLERQGEALRNWCCATLRANRVWC